MYFSTGQGVDRYSNEEPLDVQFENINLNMDNKSAEGIINNNYKLEEQALQPVSPKNVQYSQRFNVFGADLSMSATYRDAEELPSSKPTNHTKSSFRSPTKQ